MHHYSETPTFFFFFKDGGFTPFTSRFERSLETNILLRWTLINPTIQYVLDYLSSRGENGLGIYDILNKPGPAISVLSINSFLGMFWTIFSAISLGLTFCPLAFIILKQIHWSMFGVTKEGETEEFIQKWNWPEPLPWHCYTGNHQTWPAG